MNKEAIQQAVDALLWANNEINEWRHGAHGYAPVDCPQIMKAVAGLQALAEQPAPRVVDCHTTGVCVQSGLRAEQPAQQEPFAWANKDDLCADTAFRWCEIGDHKTPVYTTPQPAQRKPLTDEEIKDIRVACGSPLAIHIEFARAIEVAHGIKENT